MGQVSFAGKEIKKGPPHGTQLWRAGQKEAWLGGKLDSPQYWAFLSTVPPRKSLYQAFDVRSLF